LRERQRQSGAVFADDSPGAGSRGPGPVHFGKPQEEYAAAVSDAAFFDWSDHALIEMTGSDRVTFLHNFCTNDIKRLQGGQGCEAFVTNVKGRILGHVWIEAGNSAIRLDAGPVPVERLLAHLERYVINEGVAIADRSEELGELLVMGPDALRVISRLNEGVERIEPLAHIEARSAFGPVRISRREIARQAAYVVAAPRAALGELWDSLCKSGARPAGSEVWSALRIEAGLPIYGVDLTEDNLAQEAGRTQSAISFTKGCYLGQEPIARIDAMGHVNRELRSLRIAGDVVPSPSSRVFADSDATLAVGAITSAAFSPGDNSAVALAMLRSTVAAPGTRVFVVAGASILPATVFWSPAGCPT
jgi:tRNA-modifying protein YgfZ